MAQKWSKDQYLKYSATMKRKRDERAKAKQPRKPFIIDAIPDDQPSPSRLKEQHEFFDNLWDTLKAPEKARALGYLLRDIL